MQLSTENYLKLIEVFKQHNWDIPLSDPDYQSRFNRFCQRLSKFNAKEQALIIELTKEFKDINGSDYNPCIVSLLNRIHNERHEFFVKNKKFYVLPLISPEDFNKTKSSRCVWYNFHDESIVYNPIFLGKELVFCDLVNFSWLRNIKENEAILLLDDYIGSGETAINAISWLSNEYGIDPGIIAILTIAAQEQGITNIKTNICGNVFTHLIRKKGISDYFVNEKLKENTKLMNEIEKKLKVQEAYSFGYNRSEALISLIKTPNNTFPVFWFKTKKNDFAPFKR